MENPELSLVNEVFYCTRLGKVKGILTVTEHVAVFDPISNNGQCEITNSTGIQIGNSSEFQTFIDTNDIIHCDILELGINENRPEESFIIELMLSRTGREKRGVRSNIPKINVYFKLSPILSSGEALSSLYLKMRCDQILALVLSSIAQVDKNRADSGTFVPFYEINRSYIGQLNSGLELEDSDEEFKEYVAEIINEERQQQDDFELPVMNINSKLLSPKQVFQIQLSLPNVFKQRKWSLLYCTYLHGRSINSFYSYTNKSGPNILTVKDHKGFVFGGYFPNSWVKSYAPYGSGECYVFTFRNTETIKIFYASLANFNYMFSDHESIIIGAGGSPAIFINKDFEGGSSGRSNTFNNHLLSSEDHYQIVDLEVWGLV